MKNQVPQFSFEIVVGDLMSVLSHEFVDIIFFEYLDILEEISGFMSDPFTLLDLDIPANSYMIAYTNIHNLLKKEKIVHLPPQWSTLLDVI